MSTAPTVTPDHTSDAVEQLVVEHLDVATSIARRFRNRGIEDDDLRQVAHLALINAARKYDASRGHDFMSFAVPTIRGELRKHFRDRGWMVRPPRRVQELQSQLTAAQAQLQQQLGRPATPQELADEVGVAVSEVHEAQSADGCFHPSSLDRPVGGSETPETLGQRLADDVEHPLGQVEATVVLGPLVKALPERDRLVLRRRFYDDWTQRRIGEELGISQMQVSRMLARILQQLRQQASDDVTMATAS